MSDTLPGLCSGRCQTFTKVLRNLVKVAGKAYSVPFAVERYMPISFSHGVF
jgi:hypothetical protein